MSQYTPQDETQEIVSGQSQKVGNAVKNKASKTAKSALKKGAQKAFANLAKNGLVGVGKALLSALASALGFLLPYIIGLVVVVILVASFWDWLTFDWVNEPAENGQFQVESVNENNIRIITPGSKDQIETSLGNDMAGIFYTKYAKTGYFYTLDNNSTIIPGDLTGEIIDFEGRETMFVLSPQMLMALDLGLNNGYKIPEQFVKPVYNSCMIEGEGKSTDGYCQLLSLIVDKTVQPQGNIYEEKYYKKDDVKPEGVSPDFVGTLYVKTDEKSGSVFDWGLAPIFHYKSFQEDSRVVDYAIKDAQIYNPVTKKVETKLYSELTEAEKADYPVPPTEFNYGDKEDSSKQLPEPETKYAIDNVVSFLGTIQSEVTQEWIPQGKFQQTSYIDKVIYSNATTQEMLNETLTKRVCTATNCYTGTKVELVPDTTDIYTVSDSYNGRMVPGVVSIEVLKTIQLAYTKIGTLEVNTVEYVEDEPNTNGIVGTEYLEDYVDLYKTYIPLSGVGANRFACYDVGGVFADKNWDEVSTNDSFTTQQVLNAIESFKTATPASYQSTPSNCKNGQVALSITDEVMDKFYFDEMPTLQYLMIAKLLNYQLDKSDDGQLTIESTLSTIDAAEKPNITEYYSRLDTYANRFGGYVTKYSKAYGIDENLVYAIMMSKASDELTQQARCSFSDGAGCGVMSVKAALTNSSVLKVKNYISGGTEELVFDESKLISDNEFNIRFGIATLQNLLVAYEGNMLLALEAYTATTRYTDMLVAQANSQIANLSDVRWTAFRSVLGYGDPLFLENVLKSTISDVLQFNVNDEIITADISFLRGVRGATSDALIRNLNQFISNKYFSENSTDLETIWGLLFLNQKAYNSEQYNEVTAGTLIDTKEISIYDKESIIQSLFAFSEGKAIQNYENMDKEYWRTKVKNLFMNTGSSGIDVLYPAQLYINGVITGVVSPNTYLVVTRDYGTHTTAVGSETYDDVEYQTLPGTKILSMTDGKIVEILKGNNGKGASITIAAPAVTKEDNGKTVVEYLAKFYYTELGEIEPSLKVGDEIKNSTVIGTVSNANKNRFNLSYYLNGKPIDADLIVNYVQYLIDANNEIYSTSSKTNPEWVNGLSMMDFGGMTFSGSPTWTNPVAGGVLTAGTWKYSFGNHDAADIGAPVGTPIVAMGDGVILDYVHDGADYKTKVRDINNPSPLNRMTYVMSKGGNVYTVQLIHIQQGSARTSSYTFKEGDVIANVGDNGKSTGPHVHMSVINHGSQVTVQEIVDIYVANPGKPFFGINPRTFAYDRCENKSTFPCGVAIDKWIFK